MYNFRYRYILLLSTLDDRSENNSILGIGTSDSKFLAFFPVSVKFFRFFLKTRARFDDIQIQKNNLRIKTKVGLLMRERSKRKLVVARGVSKSKSHIVALTDCDAYMYIISSLKLWVC